MRCRGICVLILAGGMIAACDDRPTPPPDVVARSERQAADEENARPTTQQLLEDPRKTIRLGSLPLSAKVPESWEIKALSDGAVIFLQGPTPYGEVQIQLAQRPPTNAEKIELMVNAAKKEMTENADTIRMADLRNDGLVKIFERQSIGPAVSLQMVAAEDQPGPLFRWTITYFVPEAADFSAYELNFIALPLKQYKADEQFLRKIIDSVQHDTAADVHGS